MSRSYMSSTDPQTVPGSCGAISYSNFNGVNTPYLKSTGTASITNTTAVSMALTSGLTAVNITASSCGSIPILNSTNSIVSVNITANSVASTSAQFTVMGASSATIADLGSTNLITANTIHSSSGQFQTLGSSSATLADISSTNKITSNTIASSSAVLGDISSTGNITLAGNFKHAENWTAQVIVGTCATPASDNIPRSGYYYLSSSSGDINRYLLQSPTRGSRVTLEFNCGLTTANIAYVFACSTDGTNVIIGTASSGQIGIASCGVNPHVTLLGVSTGRWIIQSQSTWGENAGILALVSSCYS